MQVMGDTFTGQYADIAVRLTLLFILLYADFQIVAFFKIVQVGITAYAITFTCPCV